MNKRLRKNFREIEQKEVVSYSTFTQQHVTWLDEFLGVL